MITSLEELKPEVRAVIEARLAAVESRIDAAYRTEVVADLRAFLADHLTADADIAVAEALLARAGIDTADDDPSAGPGIPLRGRLGGMPVDLTPPTAERVAHTWWNPTDERLFVPRTFGLGWALNLGAVAVKLGLIEPDAEDEPFESTPAGAFRRALLVPTVLAGAVVAHYAVRGRELPDRLPSQLGLAGDVTSWTGKPAAAATDLAVAVLPTAWAVATVARGGGAKAAGALATATAASATAAGLTLWRTAALDGKSRWWVGPGVLGLVWVPAGALLLALARGGRAAEQRRDLGGAR